MLLSLALFNWFLPYVTPKNIQFGVRIPRDRESDPEIQLIRQSFHSTLLLGTLLILIFFQLLPDILGDYTVSAVSLIAELVFVHVNYFNSFRKLHIFKIKREWYDGVSVAKDAMYDDVPSFRRTISGFYFILPALALLVTVIVLGITQYANLPNSIPTGFSANGVALRYSPKDVPTVFSDTFYQMGITGLFFSIGSIIIHTRQEIDSSRPYTTYEQQHRFKMFYRDLVFVYASFYGIALLLGSLRKWEYPAFTFPLWLFVLTIASGSLMTIILSYLPGQMGARLHIVGEENEDTGSSNEDDDSNWKAGMFYFNRKDPSILVARRFGIGWGFNYGNPKSWAIIGIIACIPVFAMFFIFIR